MYEALDAAGIPRRVNAHLPVQEIPQEIADRIVSLYLAGSSAKRIAADLGLPVKQVNHLVEERGVKRSRSQVASLANAPRRKGAARGSPAVPPMAWPPELAAEVLDRYAAGESGIAIAESLGLAPSSVYRVLEDCGVLRSHGEASRVREEGGRRPAVSGTAAGILPAELAEQAVARYAACDPPRIIGRAVGVPAARVYLALRERGVVRTWSEARTVAHARAAKGQDAAAVVELPADWEAVVVERYVAGESGPAIAKGLGVPVGRVYRVLRERGVLRPAPEARRLDEAWRRMAKAPANAPQAKRRAPAAALGARRRGWEWLAELADVVVERYVAGESGETIARGCN